MYPPIRRNSEELLGNAIEQYEATGQPQRLFTGFDYQANSWQQPRWIVVKCEVTAQGTNRRAVVTNRPGARTLLEGVYDEYSERGESENRNKELKCELCADRLSDHRTVISELWGELLSYVSTLLGQQPLGLVATTDR